ncbi:MAG: RNA polymerase sigma factor [Muricoprocola sp.]
MKDVDIIDLFWVRDEKGIELVDKKYHSVCYSIAWKILTNREDSEECVNDTWFAAWRYIPPQRPPKLVAFLGKITRGFAIDMLRKKHAAKRMDMHIADITEEVKSLNTAITHNLDEHMEAEELIVIINRFLGGLSDRDRDIFVQRYWVMESIKNIAARHRMSEGAIKQNLLRNKRKLKKILEKEGRL